jgi:hypothetical protein
MSNKTINLLDLSVHERANVVHGILLYTGVVDVDYVKVIPDLDNIDSNNMIIIIKSNLQGNYYLANTKDFIRFCIYNSDVLFNKAKGAYYTYLKYKYLIDSGYEVCSDRYEKYTLNDSL